MLESYMLEAYVWSPTLKQNKALIQAAYTGSQKEAFWENFSATSWPVWLVCCHTSGAFEDGAP